MTDQVTSASLHLPAILDLKAAAALRQDFLARKGRPVEVDASAVQRLGGLCLQVILAARASWAADDQPFAIINPSPRFDEDLTLFGATLSSSAPV